MSKKKHPSGGKSNGSNGKGGAKQPSTRGVPMSRRPPRQPGR